MAYKNKRKSIEPKKSLPKKLEFPKYLMSHSRPHKLRKFVGDKKRLSKMDRVSIIPSIMVRNPKHIPKHQLSWPQAQRRFPQMNPYGDSDKDGVKNLLDCRPFNKSKQGMEHDDYDIEVGFEDIKKLKTIGDIKKLDSEYRERFKDGR